MSNWLTGVIVLLIIVILVDGFRRTYSARRNRIGVSPKMKKRLKDIEPEIAEPPESFISELPNGGARVIGYRDPLDVPVVEKKLTAKEAREIRRREEAAKRTPEQAHLNLNESVPMLMESVEHQDNDQMSAFNENNNGRIEPEFSQEHDYHEEDDAYEDDEYGYDEDELEDQDADDDYQDDEDFDDEDDNEATQGATAQQEPEEVFIINVMAYKGTMFNGNDLLDAVLKCGLRYGNMDIFHRYSDTKGEGTLLFSMANMVKPGTFDLDAMDEFETPGISLFMTLPIDADSMKSFELMVDTANSLAEALDGELKDEQRSAMTRQTIEHCRQRISDFERKKLFRRPR